MSKYARNQQLHLLSATILANGQALRQALVFLQANGIGSFRVNSRLFPLKTHPQLGYALTDLPDFPAISTIFSQAADLARQTDIRLTFHPDQFTLLSSPDAGVTSRSLAELAYHAEAAELIGADVITLHGGGAYGDKIAALTRLKDEVDHLPEPIRSRLALENDDRIYTPSDLLPVCEQTGLPFVYDVHHHRCLPDGVTVARTTDRALATWNREPLFHLSSPRAGWRGGNPRPHHDFIDPGDIPVTWRDLRLTVEVEAKAKELAIRHLLSSPPPGPVK